MQDTFYLDSSDIEHCLWLLLAINQTELKAFFWKKWNWYWSVSLSSHLWLPSFIYWALRELTKYKDQERLQSEKEGRLFSLSSLSSQSLSLQSFFTNPLTWLQEASSSSRVELSLFLFSTRGKVSSATESFYFAKLLVQIPPLPKQKRRKRTYGWGLGRRKDSAHWAKNEPEKCNITMLTNSLLFQKQGLVFFLPFIVNLASNSYKIFRKLSIYFF